MSDHEEVSVSNNGRADTGPSGRVWEEEFQAVRQDPAPNAGEEGPHAEIGLPYLPEHASQDVHERWRVIQSEFVDDPRRSVADAHRLVGELTERIVAAFTRERDSLETQWSSGEQVSTEELRMCLQRYRAFFARLLPAMPADKG